MRACGPASCLALALWLGACQSQARKTEQARDAASSWLAGITLTCSERRAGHVPAQFAARALRDARKQLQKTAAALPPPERSRTLAAAAAADCTGRSRP